MTIYERWLCLIDTTVSLYWTSFSQLYRYPTTTTTTTTGTTNAEEATYDAE